MPKTFSFHFAFTSFQLSAFGFQQKSLSAFLLAFTLKKAFGLNKAFYLLLSPFSSSCSMNPDIKSRD
jgi:hypothetical protein